MKKTTAKKNAIGSMKYEPVPNTLLGVAGEYRVEITQEELTTIESIRTILESGVDKVYLVAKDGRVEVEGDFKSVCCTMVKVARISDKSYFSTKSECKLHIETSSWLFPCPDYKYSNIKRNLERAISAILGIREVEVKSFNTGIIEYD